MKFSKGQFCKKKQIVKRNIAVTLLAATLCSAVVVLPGTEGFFEGGPGPISADLEK